MKFLFKSKQNNNSERFEILLQMIREDPEINERINQLIKLDSYQRRSVLNRWLEQLRRNDASVILTQALSFLFDNDIAKKLSIILNQNHTKD